MCLWTWCLVRLKFFVQFFQLDPFGDINLLDRNVTWAKVWNVIIIFICRGWFELSVQGFSSIFGAGSSVFVCKCSENACLLHFISCFVNTKKHLKGQFQNGLVLLHVDDKLRLMTFETSVLKNDVYWNGSIDQTVLDCKLLPNQGPHCLSLQYCSWNVNYTYFNKNETKTSKTFVQIMKTIEPEVNWDSQVHLVSLHF